MNSEQHDHPTSATMRWTQKEWSAHRQVADDLHHSFVGALRQGLATDSETVQALVAQHHAWAQNFWPLDRAGYIALSQMYSETPEFQQFYAAYDPNLLGFLVVAMDSWARKFL